MKKPSREIGAWGLVLVAVAVVGGGGVLVWLTRGPTRAESPRASLSLVETLGGGDTAGYARALAPRAFVFPADHGPHPDYRSEWWYFTGNLDGPEGRRFGFQFTIFRGALAPPGEVEDDVGEGWATRQVYLAHFTLTDVESGTFTEFERFTRASVGLAGAVADPFRVWLDDWQVAGVAGGVWPMSLHARDGATALTLRLEPTKPLVLQGDSGLSRKGPEPGNASYYYSYSRLAASGAVVVDGEQVPVSGQAWLDREWSTSALSEGQVGWDWFALQLSDGRELMVYQLRHADGSPDPMSDGVLVAADGGATALAADDFTLVPTGYWESPIDGAVYPSGWVVQVPGAAIDLTVTPVLADQELDLTFRYWEGAVDVAGSAGGVDVTGRGYVELTGYAGPGSAPRAGVGGDD